MDLLRRDITALQSEIDRLNREKLEDRLRIISLEQLIQKENSPTINKLLETGKSIVETVSSHAAPAVASFSTGFSLLSTSLLNLKPQFKSKKRRKSSAVTVYSASAGKTSAFL